MATKKDVDMGKGGAESEEAARSTGEESVVAAAAGVGSGGVDGAVPAGSGESGASVDNGAALGTGASRRACGGQGNLVAAGSSSTPPSTPRRVVAQMTPEMPMAPRPGAHGAQGSPLIAEPWMDEMRTLPALPAMPNFNDLMPTHAAPSLFQPAPGISLERTASERRIACDLCSSQPAYMAMSEADLAEHVQRKHGVSWGWLRERGFADALKRRRHG